MLCITIGRNAVPLIHCLLTNKDEELYTAVLYKIKALIPQLQPTSAMSDWEIGGRNACKKCISRNQNLWLLVSLYTSYLEKNPKM